MDVYDHAALDRELNQAICRGKTSEAFERFYSDDVVMEEPGGEVTEGKAANRTREQELARKVREVHAELGPHAVNGDVSLSQWTMAVTYLDGRHRRIEQVAVRLWKDGMVARERFFYEG
ncbi:MAG: nuclear transport factor 2 family protein [Thermoanaerobaculia bacterium]|nr:nuclear transport factor 2 family protein [Thermoanaerobaculia bacterium]